MRYLHCHSQGLFGNISWSALNFLTMWFQYTGLSDTQAAILFGTCIFFGGCGAILGGHLGDCLTASCSRWHARPMVPALPPDTSLCMCMCVRCHCRCRRHVCRSVLLPCCNITVTETDTSRMHACDGHSCPLQVFDRHFKPSL